MRPINGVVTGTSSVQEIIIKLEYGRSLRYKNESGFKIGDKVDVFYDLTKGKIRKVLLATPLPTIELDVVHIALFGKPSKPEDWSVCTGLEPGALEPAAEEDLVVLVSAEDGRVLGLSDGLFGVWTP